jgi:hypothetical protein
MNDAGFVIGKFEMTNSFFHRYANEDSCGKPEADKKQNSFPTSLEEN